jgi:hypothetical protein
VSRAANYQIERPYDKSVLGTTTARRGELVGVEEFLHLLARAVRCFHTYPPTGPLCTEAIAACHKALASFGGRDRLLFRVAPTELIVDEVGVGRGTIVEQELVRRLYRARVVGLEIDSSATPRHLSCFCSDLIRSAALGKTRTTFADLLVEHGVEVIVPQMADRPEVLDIGAPPAPVIDLVGAEQRRQHASFEPRLGGQSTSQESGGRVGYLYPPNKGWVRLDPGIHLDHVSLIDLAILVDHPAALATMLLRLTDDQTVGADEGKTDLERKFSDVATIFAALDPRLARVMFGKLSRAVLELAPASRTELLRRTILPGLLDGRADGTVLCDFPNVDLADSLCLLLELETAAPEVLTAALNRLDLPAERREMVIPLIDARLRSGAGSDIAVEPSKERHIDRLARRLVRIDAAADKDFSEFSAFDLSIDEQAATALVATREAIDATDLLTTQLGLLWNLSRLEPNPTVVDIFQRRVLALFVELSQRGRWQDLVAWASRYRQLADDARDTRPEVANAISEMLAAFAVPARAAAVADLHDHGADGRQLASAVVQAFGVAILPGLMALLDDPAWQPKASAVISLMCDHAKLLAPVLARQLRRGGASPTRAMMKVLGFAGAGHEILISEQLERADEQTSSEALRALARIGTMQAAAIVTRQLSEGNTRRRAAAEDAFWQFPAVRAAVQLRQLLGSRDFVVQHSDVAASLLAHAVEAKTQGLDDVLANLEPLRFRFWNPGLMRVGRKARELRAQ